MKKHSIKSTALFVTAMLALGASGMAQAGDCKKVTFKFTNDHATKVKVRSIDIKGNDGSWNEDISNKEINTHSHYSTDRRNLQKLDSGKQGTFTVNYDVWNAANSEWRAATRTGVTKVCNDEATLAFSLK